jgi:hypothetical protein
MRDVLIHDYIGVDLDEVRNVAPSRIPELQGTLEQFLAAETSGSPPPVRAETGSGGLRRTSTRWA